MQTDGIGLSKGMKCKRADSSFKESTKSPRTAKRVPNRLPEVEKPRQLQSKHKDCRESAHNDVVLRWPPAQICSRGEQPDEVRKMACNYETQQCDEDLLIRGLLEVVVVWCWDITPQSCSDT